MAGTRLEAMRKRNACGAVPPTAPFESKTAWRRGSPLVSGRPPRYCCLDKGQLLEDAVYLEIRRRNPYRRESLVCSFKTKKSFEIDLIVGDALADEEAELYQVCASLDDGDTFAREVRALWDAMEEPSIAPARTWMRAGGFCGPFPFPVAQKTEEGRVARIRQKPLIFQPLAG